MCYSLRGSVQTPIKNIRLYDWIAFSTIFSLIQWTIFLLDSNVIGKHPSNYCIVIKDQKILLLFWLNVFKSSFYLSLV